MVFRDGSIHWELGKGQFIYDQVGQVVRMIGFTFDITERKVAQLNEQFLNELDLRLRKLADADAMVWESIKSLGEYLNVERAVWHEVNLPEDIAIVNQDWRRQADIESVAGTYRLSEFILPDLIKHYQAGQPAVVSDVATYPYTAPFAHNFATQDIGAFVSVPCFSEGRWVALLAINASKPHIWRSDQVALLQAIVARLWSIIVQAKAFQVLRESQQKLSLFVQYAPVQVAMFDRNMHYLAASQRWLDILQLGSIEAVLGRSHYELLPSIPEYWRQAHQQGLAGATIKFEEDSFILPDGTIQWSKWEVQPWLLNTEEVGGIVIFVEDITARKQSEAQIELLAYYDPLTELPNRRLLLDRIDNLLSLARKTGHYSALLFIDLDQFKTLNDARGHDIGDLLLKEVAMRLKQCLDEADMVARFGGDEFVIVLPELSNKQDVAARLSINIAEKIRISLSTAFILKGVEVTISASIGITLFPKGTETVNDLLKQADTAMYKAKASGRNMSRLFEQKMQLEVESRFTLERELRCALEQKQFLIYLQPQFNAKGSLVGAEALLRWQHPSRGFVPPCAFIPVAEETGLIVSIGEWVLQEVCLYLTQLQASNSPLHLSVNISPRQFRQSDFILRLKAILAYSGASPNHLTLEVTEGLIVEDVHTAIAIMSELQTLGIHFSIDDFGTGYSSLAYLKRLPLNELKIDKSFVQDAPSDPNDAALVEAIIAIAHNFNLAIVGEGIETIEQANFLKERGCNVYQGYLYGKPMPISEFDLIAKST